MFELFGVFDFLIVALILAGAGSLVYYGVKKVRK